MAPHVLAVANAAYLLAGTFGVSIDRHDLHGRGAGPREPADAGDLPGLDDALRAAVGVELCMVMSVAYAP